MVYSLSLLEIIQLSSLIRSVHNMKKATLLMLGSFMLLSLLLVACGDKDEVENPPENANDGQEQQTDNNNTDVDDNAATDEIGRASCRERVEDGVGVVTLGSEEE